MVPGSGDDAPGPTGHGRWHGTGGTAMSDFWGTGALGTLTVSAGYGPVAAR